MRTILSNEYIHPSIEAQIGGNHAIVNEVTAAIKAHPVVVVGMAQNPFVKSARKLLDEKGVSYEYLEYGSYFSKWRDRLAIKLWSGFTTFPQIFVAGMLIGGFSDLKTQFEAGNLFEVNDVFAKNS